MAQLGGAWHTSPIGSCTRGRHRRPLDVLCEQDKQRLHWKKEFPNRPFAAALSVALQPGQEFAAAAVALLSDCPPRE